MRIVSPWGRGKTSFAIACCVLSGFAGAADLFTPSTDFTDNGDGTVTHKTSGLTWMRCSLGQAWTGSTCSGTASKYTFDEARAISGSFAGYSDWRLPSQWELTTIIDYDTYAPSINQSVFPNTPSDTYWSGTAYATNATYTWRVRFDYGYSDPYFDNNKYRVRMVRGSQSSSTLSTPTSDFTDNGDGTVTHKKTQLIWKRCAEGQTWTGSTCSGTPTLYTFDQAQALTSSFAGRSDWRMPNIQELQSIVEYGVTAPAINTTVFPTTDSVRFWTSSLNNAVTSGGFDVYFSSGVGGNRARSDSDYVRLVTKNSIAAPTSGMTLRDAAYLYNHSVNAKGDKVLVGVDCDIFQLVLSVVSGYTQLAMGQGSSLSAAQSAQTQYPDTIQSGAAMFAYALSGTDPVKSFTFNDKNNPTSSSTIGNTTAFGYCYSTKSGARVYSQNKGTCTNTYSTGQTTSCNTADDGSGTAGSATTMMLRDAIYLYGQAFNGKGDKVLTGENCDVFQLVLDVNTGYTDLAMGQGSSLSDAVGTAVAYPDRIYSSADMFSYALYGSPVVKAFVFNDKTNPASATQTGSATAFGYCYSTQSNARVYLRETDKCTDKSSSGATTAVAGCTK